MKPSYYGVTPPVSEALPSRRELELNQALIDVLAKEGMIESEERTQLRETVLFELGLIVNEFVYKATISHQPEHLARHVAAKLFTYGSYRLGAQTEESDIDTLCVCPQHVSSHQFFSILPRMLRRRKEVTELTTVTDAFVPVIKMVFSSVHIDLIYARLWLPTIPPDLDLSDDKIMMSLDEHSTRTANGPRTASEILSLVPNVDTFRTALKCIKLWAKRRAIYSNAMGYLGGVAWAILVARVCQLYPNGCPATIISRFFRIFYTWKWPSPVVLKHIDKVTNAWDPKKNKHHIMPIITPAYPSMCSTHNILQSTMKVLLAELTRASTIVDKIILGTTTWQELFVEHNFFELYKHYIRISVCSNMPDLQISWQVQPLQIFHFQCGRIESRIRRLVTALETRPEILVAHPLIDGISSEHLGLSYEEIQDVAYNDFIPSRFSSSPINDEVNEKPNDSEGKLYTTKFYIGLLLRRTYGVRKTIDLTAVIKRFIHHEAYSFEHFDHQTMGITAQLLKRSHLTSDVLTKKAAMTLKRTRSQAELDELQSESSS